MNIFTRNCFAKDFARHVDSTLGGNFSLTSSMILRLFILLDGSDNADVAVRALKSVIDLPQITSNSDAGRDRLLHHVCFSIEYLRRSRLLDKEGKPINLFNIVTHLYVSKVDVDRWFLVYQLSYCSSVH
jgi:hypothetical protein